MEPTEAVMEQRAKRCTGLERGTSSSASGYQLFDMADEEVHFSREPPDLPLYYYPAHTCKSSTHLTLSSSASQASCEKAQLTDVNLLAANSNSDATQSDQVTSSRLLSSIGLRLRRGSNYLSASKVVGQYLLGITIQSWCEFFNTERMMRAPCARNQLTRRLLANLSYFQGNYLCVALVLVIYCILSSPLLLFAMVLYLLVMYTVTARSALGKQTRLLGHRLTLNQQYSFVTMLALPPLWIAGAPSALFWVMGATFFVVGLHASVYANESALATEVLSAAEAHTQVPTSLQVAATVYKREEKTQFATRYYNHNASIGLQQQQVNGLGSSQQLPGYGLLSAYQAPETNSTVGDGKRRSSASYMPIALSNWIPFGTRSSNAKESPLRLGTTTEQRKQQHRVPEVKIISHDYAGLGRIYEV